MLKENARLILGDGHVLRITGYARPGRPVVVAEGEASIEQILQLDGMLALPHYIHRTVGPADLDDYQTVYASRPGAIAAPTAGLHFTDDVFKALADAGIRTATVTLHIGPGTFAPVRALDIESHTMESEWYTIPPATQAAVAHARRIGGRIITVGTSSTRALESWAITGDIEGFTGLFIHPGFRFKLADAMLTNFHMPRTTVLALVMAFAGRDQILSRVPRSDSPSLPLSQLRRRDVDPVNAPIEFSVTATEGDARTGRIVTPHGAVATPAFMPVGTRAAVKAMAPDELWSMGYTMVLANAYHLALRPGADLVREMGGVARFMGFPGAVLTDSGGFQAMSLAKINSINEEGIHFRSHLDGTPLMLTPESAIDIQQQLGADIMMALDECTPFPGRASPRAQARSS